MKKLMKKLMKKPKKKPNEYTWGYEEDGIIEEGPETKTLSRIEEMMNIL